MNNPVAGSAPRAAIFGFSGLELTAAERAFFRAVRPVGYILFARNVDTPAQVSALVSDLKQLVPGDDPLILIDQEGGRVRRLKPPHWRASPPMAPFGALYSRDPQAARDAVRINMQLIGQELLTLGIDVDCAPVMDVPVAGAHDIIGDRAFAHDPAVVGDLAIAACDGLIAAGVVPVIKHVPGHGRARADSHLELPEVGETVDTLRTSDFVPFAQFSRSGRPAFGMTAHVVYSAVDRERPATTSRRVVQEIIRGQIGFDGLLMSDDLGMKALAGPYDERAAMALAAGCDVVLHCDGNMKDMEAVVRGCGAMDREALRRLGQVAAIRGRPKAQVAVAAAENDLARVLHG